MSKSLFIKIFIGALVIFLGIVFLVPFNTTYSTKPESETSSENKVADFSESTKPQIEEPVEDLPPPVTHISTPKQVKAIYLSAWVAGSKKYLDKIIPLIDETEVNAVVIDIKDSTGIISFKVEDPYLAAFETDSNRISDIRALTKLLHDKNVYVIGRVSVFQDPFMTKKNFDWAVHTKGGAVWKDRKGLSFLDPANEEVWKYTVAIAKESYKMGFDEINFDYIRYPSDGKISDINYRLQEGKKRADNIESFFQHLSVEMKKDENIPISADLFGLTAVNTDDIGIGQVLEKALPYFDFVAPMVYPSHFAGGWGGFKNPAEHPYEVVNISMKKAGDRAEAMGLSRLKLRPWLQDFDMGAKYTSTMVKDQIKATYDAGLDSWMLWDPSNTYTLGALESEKAN